MGPAYWNLDPLNLMERLDYDGILRSGSPEQNACYFNAQLYKQLVTMLPKKNYVILNAKPQDEASCMFYSGFTTYRNIDEQDYLSIKQQNFPIAAFPNNISDYLKNDTSVFKIPIAWR